MVSARYTLGNIEILIEQSQSQSILNCNNKYFEIIINIYIYAIYISTYAICKVKHLLTIFLL